MCSKIIPLATVIVSVHLMKGSSKNTYLVCTEAEFNVHEGGGQPFRVLIILYKSSMYLCHYQ